MYAVQWHDDRSDEWLMCSAKGQLEVYDSLSRAQESLEQWKRDTVDAGHDDKYRLCQVVVSEVEA